MAALKAGADVLLIPKRSQGRDGRRGGRGSRREDFSSIGINESVLKVLNAKYYTGLTRSRITDPDAIADNIHNQDDEA